MEMEGVELGCFYSSGSDVFFDAILDKWSIPIALVKILLGGKWPDVEDVQGFNFEAVDRYLVKKEEETGEVILVPDDGFGTPCPGPDFKLTMIPFL